LDKEKISALVKEGRLEKGYTQQELADLVKINLRSVQRIENAEVLPRLYTLRILADKLGFAYKLNKENSPIKLFLNKSQKIILSIGGLLVLFLLVFAFFSQTSKFPETSFELFLFLAVIIFLYCWFLFRMWK